jgi:transposase
MTPWFAPSGEGARVNETEDLALSGGFHLRFSDSKLAKEPGLSRRTEQWERIEDHLPGRAGTRGRSGVDNRLFVDAILWMAGNAARWRDLPEVFGKWSGVHARFRRWSHAGVWERLFRAMAATPDFEYVLIDSTISKVHADATRAKGGG